MTATLPTSGGLETPKIMAAARKGPGEFRETNAVECQFIDTKIKLSAIELAVSPRSVVERWRITTS